MDKQAVAKRILPLIDLTSLNETDDDENIKKLCASAVTPCGKVAAVCIYSRFVKLAKTSLAGTSIKIATVCNFPTGDQNIDNILQETKQAITDGADEIDLVIPYKDYLNGNTKSTTNLVSECKKILNSHSRASGNPVLLKVILETGALQKPEIITAASEDVIAAGADFLKTSTGKIVVNATPKAAQLMLQTIHKSNRNIGFKAAGGIRTVAQTLPYLQLEDDIMDPDWATPQTFRFGASSLLGDVNKILQN
jgi:deoxyribose-phosphate aldolase